MGIIYSDHEVTNPHEETKNENVNILQRESNVALKQKIFKAMNELEGWCTTHKASILIDLILMTKPQTVVEIGVWGGKSLIPMAFALQYNANGKIYGIDPWNNVASVEGMDGANKEWWHQVDHEGIYQGLRNKISKFNLNNEVTLIRSTSENAPVIHEIGLLHIDGNHSEKASYIDVLKWVPYVKKGGLIIFDDINWSTTKQAVTWLDANCLKFAEFTGDNIWGIWIKK